MIPISKPFLGEEEAAAAREVILSGWITQGPKGKEFEQRFAEFVSYRPDAMPLPLENSAPRETEVHACAVSNCTTALHLALLGVGVLPGDVVITVSHSYIATANAVRYCSAEPVFVDIDPITYNISPELVAAFLDSECTKENGEYYYRRTKELAAGDSPLKYLHAPAGRVAAILAVHQIGMPCDLEALVSLSSSYGIPLVEDAACAIGSELRMNGEWKRIGDPQGEAACFSFHPRKVLSTGDGGMITTKNKAHDQRFRLLRQHGMSVPDTIRHGSPKVIFEDHVVTAFNYRLTDIQAAVGITQLSRLPEFIKRRRALDRVYRELLQGIAWLTLPYEPDHCRTNWQSYALRVSETAPRSRNEVMQYLLDNGIASRPGIMNAHQELPYRNSHFVLPESEHARASTLLLPLFHLLREEDIERIASLLRAL